MAQPKGPVGALFAGRVDDGGFMESGYKGLLRARDQFGLATRYIDGVLPQRERLTAALRELAGNGAALVIAHGGQNNEAAKTVAGEFLRQQFVITQGNVAGANLASYDVLQEQSAFLAGALAGLLTRSGTVGHMSGIRVVPGLKGRAAFADGLRATNPRARLLTNFSGNQDDTALARRVALAEIDAGADIIFTMLNAGRDGATDACRERGVKQIGNVKDWVAAMPEVFVASAIADVGLAVFGAARDWHDGRFPAGEIRRIGLENPEAVRLTLAATVPADAAARIKTLQDDIIAGRLRVTETYDGPEFNV